MKRFLLILMPFMAAFFLFSSCAADSGNDEKDSKNTGGDETVYYTLVLDANGGEGSVTYSDIKANQEFLLETASALGVKREGYTFLGWARNAASSTANYSDGGKVVVNTNIKLYAVWKKDATPENPNPDTPTPQEPENPKKNSLDCLIIESAPQKSEYYTGDSVDLTGIVVKAKYTDGTAKSLETSDFNYSPKTLSSAGTQTVTVTYKEKTVTFDIKVYALLTGLAWSSKPTKTKYNLGDAVDTTGAKLLATYSDGTNKTIETGFTVTPETLETEGTQVITIGFGDKTVTYSVEVIKAMNFSLDVTINDFTDIEGLLSYDEGAKTFIAKDDFKYYAWWLDNKKITNSNGFCKITQSLVSDKLNHTIMVIVTDDDGNRYSATAEFSIR